MQPVLVDFWSVGMFFPREQRAVEDGQQMPVEDRGQEQGQVAAAGEERHLVTLVTAPAQSLH